MRGTCCRCQLDPSAGWLRHSVPKDVGGFALERRLAFTCVVWVLRLVDPESCSQKGRSVLRGGDEVTLLLVDIG